MTELVGLTGLPDIKAGGAFALTELFDEYDSQKKFFQLEEAHFDEQVKEWHVQYAGRVFPLKSGFSDFYLLEKYLTDNQLHPVGHIYFDEQDTTDPHDPGHGDHNTTDPVDDPKDPGYGDHNTTDPYDPNKDDHDTTDPGTDSNDSNPLSIPVFELKVTELVGLTGLPDIKAGGAFALTELFDEYDSQKKFFQLEEAYFDQQVKEWHVQYEGRVFPLKSGFSDLYLLEKYLTDNQLHPVGHIYFDEQKDPYPGAGSDDHNKTDPDYDPYDPGYGDHNTTDPYDPDKGDHDSTDKPYAPEANPPIVQTRRAEILDDGSVHFHGRILFDGGSPILEAGIWVEDDYTGEIFRLTIDQQKIVGAEFFLTTDQLAPSGKFSYFAFAQNDAGKPEATDLLSAPLNGRLKSP